MSTYDIVKEPAVLPETSDAMAPAQSLLLVLQRVIVEGLLAVPVNVATVFCAKLKQDSLASVTAKFSIVTTVPCPLP